MKKLVTFMWYSNDMFHDMFKAEFVTTVSLKVPSGTVDSESEVKSALSTFFAYLPLFLTTSVKGEFRLIGNFLLLPSCPDYPEYLYY